MRVPQWRRARRIVAACGVRLCNSGRDDGADCWGGGFTAVYCCRGRGGRAECWDSSHTFDRCCAEFLNASHPFSDLLLGRQEERGPSLDPPRWGGGSAEARRPVVQAHRRYVSAAGDGDIGAGMAVSAELERLAAEEAESPVRSTRYVGVHHRLVLRRYPFMSFASPVHDLFYKAKVFPADFWGGDDFALFEAGFRTLLRCGDIAVDAGANIGGYTQMLALSVCAGGRVHSFEPFRLTFQMLNANVALGGLVNVHTHQKALSNKHGRSRAVGTDVRDPGQQTIWNSLVIPRQSVLQNEGGMIWHEEEAEYEELEHTTLDSLSLPRLDFIKIDVEAMEGHVLLGGLETIERHHPSILVEIKGFQRRKIHTLLVRDLGYDCRSVLSTNPSDFLCVHPKRRELDFDGRIAQAQALLTTDLAFECCAACRVRGPEPVVVG